MKKQASKTKDRQPTFGTISLPTLPTPSLLWRKGLLVLSTGHGHHSLLAEWANIHKMLSIYHVPGEVGLGPQGKGHFSTSFSCLILLPLKTPSPSVLLFARNNCSFTLQDPKGTKLLTGSAIRAGADWTSPEKNSHKNKRTAVCLWTFFFTVHHDF